MSAEDERKLFVAGLPDSVNESVLRELFEATGGTVVSVSLPKDRASGRPRGFGFVTLGTAEEASAARTALDGSMQSGRPISVRPFSSEPPKRGETRQEPQAGGSDRTLYVGNLPYDANQEEVEQLVREAVDAVQRVHLPAGPDGRLRGFGFVTMQTNEAAQEAVVALRDREFRGRRLTVNIAHPRGERNDRSERPRVPRHNEGAVPHGFDTGLPAPPEQMPDAARPVEGRRTRPPERAEAKTKKKSKGVRRSERFDDKRGRRSGGKWGDWDED
jgi:RNA recognition motif-containing protein